MTEPENQEQNEIQVGPVERGSSALAEYFWSGQCDLEIFHFVVDSVTTGDYVAHNIKEIIDGDGVGVGYKDYIERAKTKPGPRQSQLRKYSFDLIEMFLNRLIDNFQSYMVDIIRAVLKQQPNILSSRKQELPLEYIMKFDSIDALIEDIVEAKVTTLSHQGFADLEKWCKGHGIPLTVPDEHRAQVIMLIAGRNLCVHNRGLVDDRYKKVVGSEQVKKGEKLKFVISDFFSATSLLNSIVNSTDTAIVKKFKIPQIEVNNELKARIQQRHPKKERDSTP